MSNLIRSRKARVGAILATTAISMSMVASPAMAQPQQNGLVNVYVDDVLNNNNIGVGVAAGVAATLCDTTVNAAVLGVVRNRDDDGGYTCTSDAGGPEVRIVQAQ